MAQWAIGGIRIYVSDSAEETGQILPRLQPLSGGTIIQVFGYESTVRNVVGLVVGEANKNSIRDIAQADVAVDFETWEGDLHTGIMRKFNAKRTPIVCQTIDTLQDETAPVYEVSFEFYIED